MIGLGQPDAGVLQALVRLKDSPGHREFDTWVRSAMDKAVEALIEMDYESPDFYRQQGACRVLKKLLAQFDGAERRLADIAAGQRKG